ncbi:TrbC/VirB2 family protein [Acidovorax sp. CCYZU-2555]|uniref:TrbC/VirB2 family protein n=1 Tax=Acidovorax sp. CCYZU-2555 TaxID=2835042 RepID=UPI0020C0D9F4|nr:TrbC/VirB2 family protein [Acidovorax sp. CCYZU-2555]
MNAKQPYEKSSAKPQMLDLLGVALQLAVNFAVVFVLILPQLAHAQNVGGSFGGITAFLKSITQLLIYEWGYYIGIITLAIQGYRWKTGRIDLMQLGGWGLGIGLVFFAPNIVSDLKARSAGVIQ